MNFPKSRRTGKRGLAQSVICRILLTVVLFGITGMAALSFMKSIPVGKKSSRSVSKKESSSPVTGQSTSVFLNSRMQKVCGEDYYLMLPASWDVKKTDSITFGFSNGGKAVGFARTDPYYPSEPFSQLFDNHTEVLSQKQLNGLCLPATEVLLRHTQPAASGDSSHIDQYHIYFISGSTSYELCFISTLVDENTALQIAGSFQTTPVKIIGNAPGELTSVCRDVIPANLAYFKESKNYVLFGSLKSDPKQGVAVAFKDQLSKDGKCQVAQRYLTPQKRGAVKAVCGGAKDTIADVTAADGYEWIFNLYNGFTGGHGGTAMSKGK